MIEIVDLAKAMDEARYSRVDVLAITGLTDGQLKGILDRKVVELKTHNPGSGNPRFFSASDAIKIVVAGAMARIGVPMRHVADYAELVDKRGRQYMNVAHVLQDVAELSDDELLTRLPKNFHLNVWWMLFPMDERDGKWSLVQFHSAAPFNPADWPISYSVLQVDQIIQETARRIAALETGEIVPEREGVAKLRELHERDGDK